MTLRSLVSLQKKRTEKESEGQLDAQAHPERPQRYSKTSGVEQIPTAKRTWTVGDAETDETHRGGAKHAKRSKKGKFTPKAWGTGVNLIPVG